MNYYYLVAGLADISFETEKSSYSVAAFKEEIYPSLTEKDRRLVDLVFQQYDQQNILNLLKVVDNNVSQENILANSALCSNGGLLQIEQLAELIVQAKQGDKVSFDCPKYLYDFVQDYFNMEQSASSHLLEDKLKAMFYDYATKVDNKFIAEWFKYNLDLKNLMVAYTARKYSLNASDFVVGNNEVAEALKTSGARDWGLSASVDYLDELLTVLDEADLALRERKIDLLKWNWLEENSFFNYFSIEKLFVFLQKIQMVERWISLDKEKGQQLFRTLISNLKSEVSVPLD